MWTFSVHLLIIIVSTFSSGQVNSNAIEQSPPQIVEKTTMVTINCRHGDSSRPVMLWYQQRQDSHSMTLIGFGYGTGNQTYEGKFQEQFELKRESSLKGTLIVRSASLSHSAVYFCAASAQWCGGTPHPHKNTLSVSSSVVTIRDVRLLKSRGKVSPTAAQKWMDDVSSWDFSSFLASM